MYRETKLRTLVKAISYRLTGTLTTIIWIWIFTKQITVAVSVGVLEAISKIFIFYFHDRVWGMWHWGKVEIQPAVIWCTGISNSGKWRLSQKIAEKLRARNLKVELISGHEIRRIIPDTGYDKKSRIEHIQKVGLLVSRLEKNGVFVVASFISPDLQARSFIRNVCQNYIEVFVSTPVEHCEKTDTSNLYGRARKNEIEHVAGVHFQYEESENPDFKFDLTTDKLEEMATQVVESCIKHSRSHHNKNQFYDYGKKTTHAA